MGWLEATAYLRVLPNLKKLGLGQGPILALSGADMHEESIRVVARRHRAA